MWRAAIALALLSVAATQAARVASEGGYLPEPYLYETEREAREAEKFIPNEQPEYDWDAIYREYLNNKEQQPNDKILEEIVREVGEPRQEQELYDIPEDVGYNFGQEPQGFEHEPFPEEAEPIREDRASVAKEEAEPIEKSAPAAAKEEVPEKSVVAEEKPLVAQKKGQSEYVSFVEPVPMKQTKSVPSMDKRRLAAAGSVSSEHMPTYSSNLLVIAVGTVMCVGLVGTVAGGLYYKRRRETPDDSEYAPYAGTGPGFKKNKKGEKGDETLAYKAQLHHYQQAKQKIICGDDAPGMVDSDGEDENVDDENNFSVYECPGLAPTGDIEVVNPNFAAQP